MTSKYDVGEGPYGLLCPFCEKPMANPEHEAEFEERLTAADNNDADPELRAWEGQFCWYGWAQPGQCRNGMGIEERLIEVLEQRDAARTDKDAATAEVERLRTALERIESTGADFSMDDGKAALRMEQLAREALVGEEAEGGTA